jgi:uncharacterized protein (DUF433 family)
VNVGAEEKRMALAELLVAKPPPIREDRGGVLRIGQTRVTLDSVVASYRDGASAEEIAAAFPSLALGEVHAAIGFYLENQERVDAYLLEGERESERQRSELHKRFPTAEIRSRILARRAKRVAGDLG